MSVVLPKPNKAVALADAQGKANANRDQDDGLNESKEIKKKSRKVTFGDVQIKDMEIKEEDEPTTIPEEQEVDLG